MPLAAVELARLANEVDLITVRNNQKGTTVFQDDNLKLTVIWEGSGDPAGGDVQQCSAALLRSPQFLSTVARDILVIEDAPDVLQNALDRQRRDWESRQAKMAESATLAARASDKVVGKGVACIAPMRGGEICGSYALQMGINPKQNPPLCGEHMHLSNQYVLSETGNIDADGDSEVVWKRATLVRG